MSETVALIDYGSGNLRSAAKALERAARETGRDADIVVTGDAATVRRADRIVLPGVGAFNQCSTALRAVPGLWETLDERVRGAGTPFLGICVGLQLTATRGLEHGIHDGLGWIAGDVVPLEPADPACRIPHMGWNRLHITGDHPVLRALPAEASVYFVHSFHLAATDPATVLATTDHGGPVTAVAGRDTVIGTQFHPEKSQAAGLALLAAFLSWRP